MKFASALLLAATACANPPGPAASAVKDSRAAPVCADQAAGETPDGDPVVICRQRYAERPYVRPEADRHAAPGSDEPSTLTVVVRTQDSGGLVLQDRRGREYAAVGPAGQPLPAMAPLLRRNHMPTTRAHMLLYRATGVVDGATIRLADLVPAIFLDQGVPESVFLGVWEGTISLRIPGATPPQWDTYGESAPVRVRFDRLEPAPSVAPGMTDLERRNAPNPPDDDKINHTTLPSGFVIHRVVARPVANRHQGVRAADGTCLPALSALGAANPLLGAGETGMTLTRFFAMHGVPFSVDAVMSYPDGLLANNAMDLNLPDAGHDLYGLFDLIRADEPAPASRVLNLVQHGPPLGTPVFRLHPVAPGADLPCR